jgi:hypothetical protein
VNSDNTNQHFYPTTDHNNLNISDQSQVKSSDSQQERSSQDLERLFYCTPPSPVKQLPMLSSCADYTTSSQNSQTDHHHHISFLDFYSTNRTIFPNDDSFSINFNSQNDIKQENEQLLIDLPQTQDIVISPKTISNTSSPSKHRVLNTPERLDQVKIFI